MPTIESIQNTVIPQAVEKPIPTRIQQTRSTPRPQNINQANNNVEQVVADPAIPAESVKLSPQLSALARKEQAYRQREQALKEREKSLESRLAEADQYSQLKSKIGSKDFSVAEELGLSYEEYTKYLLDKQAGEDPQTQAFKKLEEEIQALKKGQEEQAAKEYEDTVAEYKSEIAKLVESDPQFAKIKKAGKQDAVMQLILDSWEEDNEEVSIEQAAKDVESYLGEEAKKWASLVDQEVRVETAQAPLPRLGAKTLTQQMQPAGVTKHPLKSLQHLPEADRYAEARRRALEKMNLGG